MSFGPWPQSSPARCRASAGSRLSCLPQPDLDACVSLPGGLTVPAEPGTSPARSHPWACARPRQGSEDLVWCTCCRQSPGPGPSSRLPSAPSRPAPPAPPFLPSSDAAPLSPAEAGGEEGACGWVRRVLTSPSAAGNHCIPGLRKLLNKVIPGLHHLLPHQPWGWAQDSGFLQVPGDLRWTPGHPELSGPSSLVLYLECGVFRLPHRDALPTKP